MDYKDAVQYLKESAAFGIQPGLNRIRTLLDILGNPQDTYKAIHVTGTNGKGSVTTYIAYGLFTSGLRVGRFTSPHLESYTERIMVNDSLITEAAFGQLIEKVKPAVEQMMANGSEAPTQFEILTAAAFLFFQEQQVDYAVIEVGLGGTLDSTNVITPVLSVITNVSMDHTKYCGDTVEEIAHHKAGIIKPGVPVVTAAQQLPLGVIESVAEEQHAPLYVFDKKFGIKSRTAMKGGQMVTVYTDGDQPAMLFTGLVGVHQAVNLACACMALRLLMKDDKHISEETMREGLARAKWPGRFEILSYQGRTLIVDGAHNAGGAEAFRMTYNELFPDTKKTLVMAILKDKDKVQIIREVVGEKDTVYTVWAPTERSEDPVVLGSLIQKEVPQAQVHVSETVVDGLREAVNHTEPSDVIVVCGSLYIVGDVRKTVIGH